jgi:uncharacterized protein (DUF983 family)
MSTSLLAALIGCKCPQCRQGNLFVNSSLAPTKFSASNSVCSVCGLHFEPEPGFFTGAMYVSYAFSVALLITVFVGLTVLGDPPLWVYITTVGVLSVLTIPISYRYSRVIYLYLFGVAKYRPELDL